MSRDQIPESETEMRVFHNRLRILMGIDKHELVEAGVIAENDVKSWANFTVNPYQWFIRCSDNQCAALWTIIQRRET